MSNLDISKLDGQLLDNFYSELLKNDCLLYKITDINDTGFKNCIRYYSSPIRSNKLNIVYNDINNIQYKIEISKLENINIWYSYFKNTHNNIIFNSLTNNTDTKDDIIFYKIFQKQNLKMKEYNIELFINEVETLQDVSKIQNLKTNDSYEIYFELIDILEYEIYKDANCSIILELKKINNKNRLYLITNEYVTNEINIIVKTNKFDKKKHTKIVFDNLNTILQIITRSNIVLQKSEIDEYEMQYNKLMFKTNTLKHIFGSRKPISIDLRAIIYEINSNYSVTDKIDGERHLLFINEKNVILISSNLEYKHTGIILATDEFDGTIIDGELIITSELQLFMSFDILFMKKIDLRQKYNLLKRINHLHQFLNECFNIKINNNTNTLSSVSDIKKYYTTDINKYVTNLNKKVDLSNNFIVWYKYYIFPTGIIDNEIYIYTNLIWNNFTTLKLPYQLDGVIYTPMNKEYNVYSKNKDKYTTNTHEYKLKPSNQLSIDFYIEIEKDNKTNKYIEIYDNTKGPTKYYKCLLYVNNIVNNKNHLPELFRKEYNDHFTYITIKDQIITDKYGTIITDKSVVEFTYNSELPINYRWIPLKVRLDKTETIRKYTKNYGNNSLTAYYIWEIINNPISFDDINILSTNKYTQYIEILKQKIQTTKQTNGQYYEQKTGLALSMRSFHNYIKDQVIQKYCKPRLDGTKVIQKTVLDIGIGRGGDLSKFYKSGIKKIVGIDLDDSSFNVPNGTTDKFNKLTKNNTQRTVSNIKIPNDIEGVFIKADISHELSENVQKKVLQNMTNNNAELIIKHIENQKFDIVNCQFTIHYIFNNEENLKKYFNNINKLLKKGGYLFISCFDADVVHNVLQKQDGKLIINDETNINNVDVLFSIEQQYETKSISNNFNLPINVTNKLYSNVGKIEYLVKKDVLIDYANNFADLELVETVSFDYAYETWRKMIDVIYHNNDFNSKMQSIYTNLYKYYNTDNKLDKDSLEFTKLNRLYIFRKR